MADIKQIQVDGNTPLDLNVVDGKIKLAQLNSEVTNLIDEGYSYYGVVDKDHAAITPVGKIFCIATEAGTYTNFGNLVVNEGEVAILKYNGTVWSKEVTEIASQVKLSELEELVVGDDGTEKEIFPNWTRGAYITTSLQKQSGYANWGISEVYALKKGDIITINTQGSSVVTIAESNDGDTFLQKLASAAGGTTGNKKYTYTADDDINVVLCGRVGDGDVTCFIQRTPADSLSAQVSRINNQILPSLMDDVESAQEKVLSLAGEIWNYEPIAAKSSPEGKIDVNGNYASGAEYQIKKYEVVAGDELMIKASLDGDVAFQWQNKESVAYSNKDNIVGEPIRKSFDGVIVVPDGATFLMVCQFKTNTTNFVGKVSGSRLDELEDVKEQMSVIFGEKPFEKSIPSTSGQEIHFRGITIKEGVEYELFASVENPSNDLYVQLRDSDNTIFHSFTLSPTTKSRKIVFTDDVTRENCTLQTFGTHNDVYLSLKSSLNGLLNDVVNGDIVNKDITALNPATEFVTKFEELARRTNKREGEFEAPPFLLAHFSDIHGDEVNTKRFVQFCKKYEDYIDECIHTGDIIESYYDDDFSFWSNAGAGKVLNTIGNHDVYPRNGETITSKMVYDKFFAPYIGSWGVVQPSNASSQGLCYYYKDFAKKSSSSSSKTTKIRLIVIDAMHYDSVQKTWITDTLADAKANGYSVVLASHYKGGEMTLHLDCTFCSWKDADVAGTSISSYAAAAVDAFMSDGGDFVCWIAGHTHYDKIGVLKDYPNQLCVVVDSGRSTSEYSGDSSRKVGTRLQDSFNIMAIDTASHLVKIVRVGCNMDNMLRQKNIVVYDYKQCKMIYNS